MKSQLFHNMLYTYFLYFYFTASLITNNIDSRVNPCDDFYKFACGRVTKNNENLFSVAYSLTIMRILYLLTSEINESDIPPLQKAKDFYKSCINDRTYGRFPRSFLKNFVHIRTFLIMLIYFAL